MKLDRLETHDRLLFFKKQNHDLISQGCQDCIKNRPEEFGKHAFYIFAHPRTADDGVTKRLLWSPRLTKPIPQSNSMCFKYYPASDTIKIIWIIPAKELWGQYKRGNVTEQSIVSQSIHNYIHNREKLSQKEPDDLPDDRIDFIYNAISSNMQSKKLMENLWKKETNVGK